LGHGLGGVADNFKIVASSEDTPALDGVSPEFLDLLPGEV
jgi:hypothetical protein